jgi:hypothetical protein
MLIRQGLKEGRMNKCTLALLAVLAIPGCDSLAPGSVDSYFRASVERVVEVDEFRGMSSFSEGAYPNGHRRFSIHARGELDHAGSHFWIRHAGGGRLRTGTYPVVLMWRAPDDPLAQGVSAVYLRDANELHGELFIAESGTLRITKSTKDVVAGEFTFSGFKYCPLPGEQNMHEVCSIPSVPPMSAERITVSGSFHSLSTHNMPYVPHQP